MILKNTETEKRKMNLKSKRRVNGKEGFLTNQQSNLLKHKFQQRWIQFQMNNRRTTYDH